MRYAIINEEGILIHYLPACFLDNQGQEWLNPRIFPDGHHENALAADEAHAFEGAIIVTGEGQERKEQRLPPDGYDGQGIPYVRNQPLMAAMDLYKNLWETYCLEPEPQRHATWQTNFFSDLNNSLVTDQIDGEFIYEKGDEKEAESVNGGPLQIKPLSFCITPQSLFNRTTGLVSLESGYAEGNVKIKLDGKAEGATFQPENKLYLKGWLGFSLSRTVH